MFVIVATFVAIAILIMNCFDRNWRENNGDGFKNAKLYNSDFSQSKMDGFA